MKILLVCPFYPPEGEIAALRIGKFAEHWAADGHEVRVLTRHPRSSGTTEPRHEGLKVTRVPDPLMRFTQDHTAVASTPTRTSGFSKLKRRIIRVGRPFAFPDIFVAWAIRSFFSQRRSAWRPDVVVASGGPLTAIMLGASLARRSRSQFVVDFRDPVASNPVNPRTKLRTNVEVALERRAVKHADLVCSVSDALAKDLAELHSRKVHVVMNGFSPSDYPSVSQDTTRDVLNLTYTGRIYPKNQEYKPFFEAAHRFAVAHGEDSIRLHYYGRSSNDFHVMAAEHSIDQYVVDHGEVSHEKSTRAQLSADALLLLLWNDPRAAGTLGGKLFEYIGARRPIILLAYESGDAAQIVRENHLGIAVNSADEIEEFLEALRSQKMRVGYTPSLETAAGDSYTRQSQSRKLLSLMTGLAASPQR